MSSDSLHVTPWISLLAGMGILAWLERRKPWCGHGAVYNHPIHHIDPGLGTEA